MCGLIAAFSTPIKKKKAENVNDFIINQYEEQFSRGQKGFGIITIGEKGEVNLFRACEQTKFLLDLYMNKSKMIIAHHRTPTSTDNKLSQTHPILVSEEHLQHDYLVVHNGIISNNLDLYKKHIELGFKYKTEYKKIWGYQTEREDNVWNDSEGLAIELALFIEKKILAIDVTNMAAFIILQINKKTNKATKVFFGKNGFADLNMSKTRGKLRLSSEGEGNEIKENELYSFEIKDPKMNLKCEILPFLKRETPKVEYLPTTKPKDEITPKRGIAELASKGNQTVNLPTKSTEIKIRNWTEKSEDMIIEEKYNPYPNIAEAGYIEKSLEDLKLKIDESEDSITITHLIDDVLDEETDKIIDLIQDYKSALLIEKLDTTEIRPFSGQIFRIMQGMKELADYADSIYKDRAEIELKDEYEVGYDYTQTKVEKNIEKEIEEYESRNCSLNKDKDFEDMKINNFAC